MSDLNECLVAIGFRMRQSDPPCWHVAPAGMTDQGDRERRFEPGRSYALRRWRRLLHDKDGTSPYRISRAA